MQATGARALKKLVLGGGARLVNEPAEGDELLPAPTARRARVLVSGGVSLAFRKLFRGDDLTHDPMLVKRRVTSLDAFATPLLSLLRVVSSARDKTLR